MKKYQKIIEDKLVIKSRSEIILKKTRMIKDKKTGEEIEKTFNVYNPSEKMLLEDGWVEYVMPVIELTDEQIYARALNKKLRELHNYDESKEVNDCVIVYDGSELHYWADKHERGSLESAVRNSMTLGRTHYRLDLRELGVSLNIPCEKLLQMLAVLEVYAIDCYNKTTDHEYAIKALATEAEIEAYNFKVDYPEVPRFELNNI